MSRTSSVQRHQARPPARETFPARRLAAGQLTVSVPCIPAARWPGTLQKKVYVPGLRSTVSDFVAPWNVGVAPTTGPLVPCSIVMLCISGDMFANLTVTLPAVAVSDVLVNFNAPLGSAASDSDEPVLAGGAAVVGLEEEGVEAADAVDKDVELVLLEPPHAATPSASAMALIVMAGSLDTRRLLWIGQRNGSNTPRTIAWRRIGPTKCAIPFGRLPSRLWGGDSAEHL